LNTKVENGEKLYSLSDAGKTIIDTLLFNFIVKDKT